MTVAFLLVCFRILSAIPIPGVDKLRLEEFFGSSQLFSMVGIMAGGTMSNLSIIMLGVGPYITATIIMQISTMLFPKLKEAYYEEGAAGRAKFNRYARYLTVPLAGLQAYAFLNLLGSQGIVGSLGLMDMVKNIIIIMAGSMLVMWIGEMISEQKMGNGISLIIFAGIVSSLPQTIVNMIQSYNPTELLTYIGFVIIALAVIAGVVFINEGERKIPVSYAKQVRGNKMYGGVSSYLPIKVNQAGVIPIIFAISILLFPQFLAQASVLFSKSLSLKLTDFVNQFMNNQYYYSAAYFLLVVIFTYFYTSVTFDPKEISKNLQRAGGFVAGIRPGESTTTFLSKVISRITLWGAVFLGLIAILPNVVSMFTGIAILTIGGTAILIVVSVALETLRQINSQLMVRDYE
ncbi:MAG: Protein translocase subunit SecY [Candidatus Wolfebacteria bacterium GW2011_GWC2_39_22]|uniref:Protein translocase subunit SecY n=2 Tax=Candidatus Wolfeibacteriota TaxID=1752735 RepID=A0A0G1H7E8_9BACT|nr:MAG: Protein translocase subunit SecY [Candidatus Wolfebacteria bacterium GW2011_GWC2_39_22]KKT42710.1 MAG: Protein translocase subunit SecY [Candidatus Wolfebacteria bacterium GW2011_GWE2_44_13]